MSHIRTLAALSWVLVALVDGSTIHAEDSVSPLTEDGRVVQFERDIAPILRDRCLDCHGPEDAKNDFRVDEKDTLMDYIEEGDWESSSMYVDYLTIDDPEMLMPPASKGGPLSPSELALIRVWINEGAIWPDKVQIVSTTVQPIAEVPPTPQTLSQRVWAFQGFFHPATVHFPVALFTVGAFFVILSWKWPVLGTQIPLACLLLGALSSIVASAMGWAFAVEQGYSGWSTIDFDNEFFWHRWGGIIVSIVAAVFALIAIRAVRSDNESLAKVWKVGLLVIAGMVGAVGHQGGELSYGADFYPRAFRILLGTKQDAENGAEPESDSNHEPQAMPDDAAS